MEPAPFIVGPGFQLVTVAKFHFGGPESLDHLRQLRDNAARDLSWPGNPAIDRDLHSFRWGLPADEERLCANIRGVDLISHVAQDLNGTHLNIQTVPQRRVI